MKDQYYLLAKQPLHLKASNLFAELDDGVVTLEESQLLIKF
jgi:hypothetical protein